MSTNTEFYVLKKIYWDGVGAYKVYILGVTETLDHAQSLMSVKAQYMIEHHGFLSPDGYLLYAREYGPEERIYIGTLPQDPWEFQYNLIKSGVADDMSITIHHYKKGFILEICPTVLFDDSNLSNAIEIWQEKHADRKAEKSTEGYTKVY